MAIKLVDLLAAILMGMAVMITQELPKSLAYLQLNPLQRMQNRKSVYNLKQYIDPIGLIFFVTTSTGFSKPFAYRIKDKKTNRVLAIVGFASNIIFALFFIGLFRAYSISLMGTSMYEITLLQEFILRLFFLGALFNVTMFLVNLLPITPFNMSSLLASVNPSAYFRIYQYEKMFQFLMIILIIMDVFTVIGLSILSF